MFFAACWGLRSTYAGPRGEGWLILSDLAEHLGLRTRADLIHRITDAGLRVIGQLDTVPTHPRADDRTDPFHSARSRETTTLWRLAAEITPLDPATAPE
jgi:hypothetical protein